MARVNNLFEDTDEHRDGVYDAAGENLLRLGETYASGTLLARFG